MRSQWVRVSRVAAAAASALGVAAAVAVQAADLGALSQSARSAGRCVYVEVKVDPKGAVVSRSENLVDCPEDASPGDIITTTQEVSSPGATRSDAGTLTGTTPGGIAVGAPTITVTTGQVPTYTTTTVKPKPKTAAKP